MSNSREQYPGRHFTCLDTNFDVGLTGFFTMIQADKINTLIKAANVQEVEPIWAQLFAKVR